MSTLQSTLQLMITQYIESTAGSLCLSDGGILEDFLLVVASFAFEGGGVAAHDGYSQRRDGEQRKRRAKGVRK